MVIYDGNALIPGPFLSISPQKVLSENGRVLRRFFNVTARGKVMAYAGSPRSDGSFWNQGANNPPPLESVPADSRLTALERKVAALSSLFARQGRLYEVQGWDGAASLTFNPVVKSLDFAEGKWTDYVDFTVQMEANQVWVGGKELGGSTADNLGDLAPEETWSVEVQGENTRVYRVSHSVSSQQKTLVDETGAVTKEGWEAAKAVVDPYLGGSVPAGVLPPLAQSGYQSCNYSRSQQVDVAGGRYAVTENWVLTPGQKYVEEFSVNARYQQGVTHVTVEGTLSGHAGASASQSVAAAQAERLANAEAGWASVKNNLLSRAQNYSGATLNPTVLNYSQGRNPITGVITYSYEYDNRPSGLVPGSLSETFSVSQSNPADVFAQLVVLGRMAGPVLQPLASRTAAQRTVTLEVVMPPWKYGDALPAAPDVLVPLLSWYPAGGLVAKDDAQFNPSSGRYSRTITWTYNPT